MDSFVLATAILILVYLMIIIEKIPKAVTALIGAALMLLLKLIEQDEAFAAIDFNVIFLLAGMMIIVNITAKTGIFEWLAFKMAKIAKGQPVRILIYFSIITAILSAFLDNVTTVLLMAPVTLVIARELEINPIPYFITEILASNIGGTATLIGDPPNIMIGSAAGYDFLKFVVVLGPVVVVIFIVFMVIMSFFFKKELVVTEEKMKYMTELDISHTIKDKRLLIKSLIVLGAVIIGFIFHGALHYEAATIAMAGAGVLLIFSKQKHAYEEIEWATIFFFIGLFIVIGAVEKVGIIDFLAKGALELTEGNLPLMTMLILWISGILSGVVDNIPYTATMIPLIQEVGGQMDPEPLWWSLALGACLGGNSTIIGASANVILSDISNDAGYHISFIRFLKYGILITFMSLIISSIYLWILFLT